MHRQPSLLFAGLALCACTSAPTAAIPDPLPETLAWAASGAPQAGAFLGLEVRENDSGSLDELRIDPGVRVTRVLAGSPAEAAGFLRGDVLLEWDDEHVADPATLAVLLSEADLGREARLEVQRGDSVFEVAVRLRPRQGAAPEARLLWRADPARSRAGWLGGHAGVVLVTSDPEGPFPSAGVPVGSVVTHLDGEAQRSERALVRALLAREPGARIEVDYRAPGASEVQRASVELYRPPRRVVEATLPILAGYRSEVSGETARFYLLDLWIISLFRYRREGAERHYRVLRFFTYSSGVGELGEGG